MSDKPTVGPQGGTGVPPKLPKGKPSTWDENTVFGGTNLGSESRKALEEFVKVVENEHGAKHGKTALFWKLVHACQSHLKNKAPDDQTT